MRNSPIIKQNNFYLPEKDLFSIYCKLEQSIIIKSVVRETLFVCNARKNAVFRNILFVTFCLRAVNMCACSSMNSEYNISCSLNVVDR